MPSTPSLVRCVAICALALLHCNAAGQSYVDVTGSSGLNLTVSQQIGHGSGACCGDFDGDGDEDLIIAAGPGQPLKHFRNDGGMSFTDVTATQPLAVVALVRGLGAADIDNDGDLDVAVAQSGAPLLLFINDGTGNFTEEAMPRGLIYSGPSWSPLFADYDRDGWLDLFVGTYADFSMGGSAANRLYRNAGGGWFTDVTGTTGLEDAGGLFFAGAWFDHDEDGWPDIVLANDKGNHPSFAPGSIYRNNHDGTFTNLGPTAQCLLPIDGMGADVVDLFNDGGWEVYVTDSPPTHVLLGLHTGSSTYFDVAPSLGVAGGPGLSGWACHFLDADNDGWQDIHVVHAGAPNALYRHPGQYGVTWSDVAVLAGCARSVGQYCAIVADFDDDGTLDLLDILSAGPGIGLLHGSAATGNWIKIRTEGTVSNRDGLGAIIEVTTAGTTQRQHVRTGRGYLTGSDRRTHFGLGTATSVDRLEIRWPSGATQILQNLPVNQILTCREPSVTSAVLPAAGTVTPVNLEFPGDAGQAYLLGLALDSTPGLSLPDGRRIPMNFDAVLAFVLNPNPILWPTLGTLSTPGASATVPLFLPWGSQGIGLVMAGVSLRPGAPYGASMISAAYTFQIQ